MTLVERSALMAEARGENQPLPPGIQLGLAGLQDAKKRAERAG